MGGQRQRGESWTVARGVRARQTSQDRAIIEVSFEYRGVRCRESLSLPPTVSNVRYAERLRAEIETAIERKTFRYADYFPDSKRATAFGIGSTTATTGDLLTAFLQRCQAAVSKGNLSPSTFNGYKKIINGILIPRWGSTRARDIAPAALKDWISGMTSTAKTSRNVIGPLRMVLDEALNDGIIDLNPFDKVALKTLLKKTAKRSTYVVDPFTSAERTALLAACRSDQERNLYEFWFETGVRTGELIAIRWSSIDFVGRKAVIETNSVVKVEKAPKTAAGFRSIELSDDAIAALNRQKSLTYLADDHIFHNPRTETAWITEAQVRRTSWDATVKLAGVRRRNPYQIRHTWGSRHVSAGYNLFWIAEQMGHETIEMVIKNYGKWMPSEGQKVRLDRFGTPVRFQDTESNSTSGTTVVPFSKLGRAGDAQPK